MKQVKKIKNIILDLDMTLICSLEINNKSFINPRLDHKVMKNYFDNIIYVSYLTVQPTKDVINHYLNDFVTEILDSDSQVWLLGRMTEFIDTNNHNLKKTLAVSHRVGICTLSLKTPASYTVPVGP